MSVLLILQEMPFTVSNFIELQRTEPLLWIINTAPIFLGLFAGIAGYREDNLRRAFAQLQQNERQILELQQQLTQLIEVRNVQMSAGVEINRHISEILDLEQLLAETVDQIKDRLGYYHAHIYLFDDEKENLLIAAGSGSVGEALKSEGHKIEINAASLVARAARTKEVVNVSNVRETADWLPNPLLPNTYSEMAVPIILEEQVEGVLDVQQDKVAALDEGDANLLRTIANQVAVAIRNARQFAQVETALAEARELQHRYLTESWDKFRITKKGIGRVQFSLGESTTLSEEIITSARQQALQQQKPAIVALNGEQEGAGAHQTLVAPIVLRDVVIGDLQLHQIDPDRTWTESEFALINAVVDQVAQIAENLRLLDESQERASRQQLVSQISNKMRRAPDIESLMEVAVAELSRVLGPARTFVHLDLKADPEELVDN